MNNNIFIFIALILFSFAIFIDEQILSRIVAIIIALEGFVILTINYFQNKKSENNTIEVLLEELEDNTRRINENFYWLIDKNQVFFKSNLHFLFDRCFNAFLHLNGLTFFSEKVRKELLWAENAINSSNSSLIGNREVQAEIKKKLFIYNNWATRKQIMKTFRELDQLERWEKIQHNGIHRSNLITEKIIKKAKEIADEFTPW